MKNNKTIAVLGGDGRQGYAASYLAARGFSPILWGVSCEGDASASDGVVAQSPQEALVVADALLLPLPATCDGIRLNAPSLVAEDRPVLQELLGSMPKPCHIIGGKMPVSFREAAELQGFTVTDYFDSEAFQIHNAYTTAEAALSIVMNHLSKNIRESRIAVIGYGRIAKPLTELLLRLGAEVTVAARRESDLAFAQTRGCETVRLTDGAEAPLCLANGYDAICNTVPHWLFGRGFLERADRKTLYVELASAPGGIDVCAARELVCNVCWAMSLPGKYAPISAGHLIGSCVARILGEGEGL